MLGSFVVACLGIVVGIGCGDEAEQGSWGGAQTCSVVLPPIAVTEPVAPVLLPVSPDIAQSADGFSMRNFTLGPLAGFSCVARQMEVVYTSSTGSLFPAPDEGGRGITVQPFDCQAPEGRIYELEGTGAADARGLYFTLTFTAWMDGGQGTVSCTTTLRRQTGAVTVQADAGTLPVFGDAGP